MDPLQQADQSGVKNGWNEEAVRMAIIISALINPGHGDGDGDSRGGAGCSGQLLQAFRTLHTSQTCLIVTTNNSIIKVF